MHVRTMFIFPLLFVCVACGNAQPNPSVGSLQISDVWVRPAQVMAGDMAMDMSSAISGAYMTIKNTGGTADTLLMVQGDIAAALELHSMTETNGVMQMRPVERVEIPANGEVQLTPGGMHVMLIGLKQDLKPGDSIPLTLQFEKAGTIQVIATIRDAQ
ncbi:MAG: copper chaperone PCu(A)C [Roseiflexaceae bacterium]|nr:copper chaperone PCu(A)C [Roseiflexaceae bacterium]